MATQKDHVLAFALVVGAIGLVAGAQERQPGPTPGGQGGPGEGRRPMPPILAALDANRDGVIDAGEMANASAALKALDKNGDGKLTTDELFPPRPAGPGGQEMPGRPGGGHRPPMMPVLAALDANHDRVIDAAEIASSPAALKALDKNGDGRLTSDELTPQRPAGEGRPGGSGWPGGPER